MAVGDIWKDEKRDCLVPRYDWPSCSILRRFIMTLRDAIESIAQYYNFQYPGDVSMSYYLPHNCTITTISH